MTLQEVRATIKEIEREKDDYDDEAAHSIEDYLHQTVLEHIAKHSTCAMSRMLAAEALRSLDIDFARWCA